MPTSRQPYPAATDVNSTQLALVSKDVRIPPKRKTYLQNDAGNAERLVDSHGRDLLFCPEKGFMVWIGSHWVPDEFIHVERLAEQVMRGVFSEAGECDNSDERSKIARFANASLSRKGIANMCHSVKRKLQQRKLSEFDPDPHLLNVTNGRIDLRTGKLRPHNRLDFITKIIPVKYDPKARCPTFDAFLAKVLPEKSLRDYIQRAVGCGATGRPEKVLFLLVGTGDNGKTTLLEICREALRGYAGEIQIESLMASPKDAMMGNTVNADLADLRGARFVTSSEVEQGQRFNVARVKNLTGRGQIRARHLRKPFFNFAPTHKIFLDCNHKPKINNARDAIWNRIRCVPFNVRIPKSEIDPKLPEKLRRELPGILRWIVEGAMLYLTDGLPEPPEIQGATETYQQESDALTSFLDERCTFGPRCRVGKTDLWKAYCEWTQGAGIPTLEKADFEAQLLDRGVTAKKVDHGTLRAWVGIELRIIESEMPPGRENMKPRGHHVLLSKKHLSHGPE